MQFGSDWLNLCVMNLWMDVSKKLGGNGRNLLTFVGFFYTKSLLMVVQRRVLDFY